MRREIPGPRATPLPAPKEASAFAPAGESFEIGDELELLLYSDEDRDAFATWLDRATNAELLPRADALRWRPN